MKVLVIPDIHLKPDVIRKAQGKMFLKKYDMAVFLGDFCDDWNQGRNIGLYDETFDALDGFLTEYPESLICYGNHDISYVWNQPESGYSGLARDTVVARLHDLYKKHGIDRWKFIHRIDNVLFSHAGLTKGFIMQQFKHDTDRSIDHLTECINKMGENELWYDASPIWARHFDGYAYYNQGYLQVVGHTPVNKPYYDEDRNLLLTDNFFKDGKKKFVWVDTETKEWGTY